MKIKRQITLAKDKILKTTIVETLKLINKNKKISATLILIDIIFFSIMLASSSIFEKLGNKIVYDISLLITTLTYILLALTIYSFFKFLTIKTINSYTQKTELNTKNFGRFVILNITLTALFLIVYALVSFILDNTIKSEYITTTKYVLITIYTIIYYISLNISHFIFINEQKVWKTIKQTLKNLLKIKDYYAIIIHTLVLFIIFYLTYIITAITAKYTIFTTQESYNLYVGKYSILLKIMQFTLLYAIIFLNRIYIKLIVDKTKSFK